ncbi:MAG: hypothetical protein IPG04_41690 [Polyangiaceae bacterium]|nr:hypothetical protein [Polyangiaceae bacterium]
MLVDVTSLMQRERSALRLLYELLVLHQPDLPLGQFLPVGSAFAAIFPEAGVEASQKVELMQDIHHQYYARIAPTMARLTEENPELVGERRRALDQLVRTVLLAEVSPKLKQGGLTVERLVQLNSVDVEGETFRSQVRVAETDLLALSRQLPDLSIAGTGKTAIVRYVLGRVSLGEVIGRARSKVDNVQQRFTVFYAAMKKALGVAGDKGFEPVGPNVGDYEITWRKTKRRGRLKIGNVREMAAEDFAPPEGAFAILVDYPWDDHGHTVDEDRLKASNVKKSRGQLHTMCWLPRHMTPAGNQRHDGFAAVRYLVSDAGQEDLLGLHGAQDRQKILEQANVCATTLEAELSDLLKEVYIHHGELFALLSEVDGSRPQDTIAGNLEHIAELLMDRRYANHPSFLSEPRKAELELLLAWMVAAGQDAVSISYDDATGKVLKTLGQPLELVNLGQTKASLRLDGRILKDVLTRADQPSVSWTPIVDHLQGAYGLQPLLIDLFLCFLCQRDHRAIGELDASPVEVKLGMPQATRLRLERGKIVEAPQWHRLRDLGGELFAEPKPSAHRSLQGQDRFAASLRAAGKGAPCSRRSTRASSTSVSACRRASAAPTASPRSATRTSAWPRWPRQRPTATPCSSRCSRRGPTQAWARPATSSTARRRCATRSRSSTKMPVRTCGPSPRARPWPARSAITSARSTAASAASRRSFPSPRRGSSNGTPTRKGW